MMATLDSTLAPGSGNLLVTIEAAGVTAIADLDLAAVAVEVADGEGGGFMTLLDARTANRLTVELIQALANLLGDNPTARLREAQQLLKLLHEAHGLRFGDVAAGLGMSPSTLSMWHLGHNAPQRDTLARLREYAHAVVHRGAEGQP
jgi:transcriptional regulator with XRE-family HTH domain